METIRSTGSVCLTTVFGLHEDDGIDATLRFEAAPWK
jgi:hypothetical protein